jgi:hypothetical protein
MIERYSHVRAEAKRKAVSVFDVVNLKRTPHRIRHSQLLAGV